MSRYALSVTSRFGKLLTMNNRIINKSQGNLACVSRQAAAEGIVLLKNEEAILPFKPYEVIALFGRCQIDTYRSGTGSGGAVNVPYAVNALQGLRENPRIKLYENLVTVYEEWLTENPYNDGGGGWAAEPWFQEEMPLTDELVKQAADQSDKAVLFIGRTAGEDQDNVDEAGSYRLTALEMDMVNKVCRHFNKVVVVFNVTNIMDMSWLNTIDKRGSIKAVLYSWAAGMEGGHALADILSGDQSPSGRLTDSVAYRLEDYPSSANFGRKDFNCYVEDIYVGYRYFETFKPEVVQYPFGAGLSYTQFSRELVSYSMVGEGLQRVLHFNIKVENCGSEFSSKEVVQLYMEAPQGKLGKPSRVLVGFAKTDTLEPSQTQIVKISVPMASLASYDDSGITGYRSSYVLEQGCYQFYLGENVRLACKIDAVFELGELLLVEQLAEALAPIISFERLKPGEKRHQRLLYRIF